MATTVSDVMGWRQEGRRFAMVTAYDHNHAQLLAEAGIRVVLVGDSLGMTVLGHETTLPVTMEDMLHHAAAVARGAGDQLLIGDMPFGSYNSGEQALDNAGRFLRVGMHAVKVEGGGPVVAIAAHLVGRGIPVMGHLGLTPQWVNSFGGFRVQGREDAAADRIAADALRLQQAGCFALVLEGMPAQLARRITSSLQIPTIGIGAGAHCSGQVLVFHDVLGLGRGHTPRFVKRYAELADAAVHGLRAFQADVEAGTFPDDEHSYGA
jgi:3-methyl-2-oxobutanoate hydroxymethyltransferase